MLNQSIDINSEDFDLLRSPVWRGLITGLYLMVILIGIIGNSLVVYVVAKHKQLQNITNVFIANLAMSDIGLCIFSLPTQLHYQLTDNWIFGSGLCRVVFAALAMPMYVSTITIMLIAFDRYWIIIYPLRQRMTFRIAIGLICLTALASFLLSIPVMYFTRTITVNDTALGIFRSYCVETWPVFSACVAYSALMFTFQFVLPVVMTAVVYSRIYVKLKQRQRVLRRADNERKNRTNKILVAIVAVFVACWLPWNVLCLIAEFHRELVKGPHFKFVDLLLKLFAMSSVCVNPFLYCWLNDNFKHEVDNIVVKFKKKSPECRQKIPKVNCDCSMRNDHSKFDQPSVSINMNPTMTMIVDKSSPDDPQTPVKPSTNLLVPSLNSPKPKQTYNSIQSEDVKQIQESKPKEVTAPTEKKKPRAYSVPMFKYSKLLTNTKQRRKCERTISLNSHSERENEREIANGGFELNELEAISKTENCRTYTVTESLPNLTVPLLRSGECDDTPGSKQPNGVLVTKMKDGFDEIE